MCDDLPEEDENVPTTLPALETPRPSQPFRRLGVPIPTLNANDLLAWSRDPTWDLEDLRRMAAELRRRLAGLPSSEREGIERVLTVYL